MAAGLGVLPQHFAVTDDLIDRRAQVLAQLGKWVNRIVRLAAHGLAFFDSKAVILSSNHPNVQRLAGKRISDTRPGDTAPNFTAQRLKVAWISINGWGIAETCSSHTRPILPVCTTELGAVARLRSKLAVSVDPLESHHHGGEYGCQDTAVSCRFNPSAGHKHRWASQNRCQP